MNIAVVTPYDSANYGAFLQAYCLRKYLVDHGHSVRHLNVRSDDYIRSLFYHDNPTAKKEKYIPGYYKTRTKYGKEKYKVFVEEQKVFQTIKDVSSSDLVILGSDEIWNLKQTAFSDSAFWGNETVPTISYASSIGGMNLECAEDFPNHIQQLRQIQSFLVRDEITKRFVEKYTDAAAELVCDPTMLVPVSEYGNAYHDDYLKSHRCILLYSYDITNREAVALRRFARKHSYKIVSCCFYHSWADHQINCGPLEFSSVISQCELFFTTTFHGTIFGILNHANFVSVARSTKTSYLLNEVGLENRLVSEKANVDKLASLFDSDISYADIDKKIECIRKESAAKLKKAIESVDVDHKSSLDCFINNCTGCFACRYVCSKGAVNIVIDKFGKSVPEIDKDKCVECDACRKVCPQLKAAAKSKTVRCYAVRGNNDKEIKGCSSGGVGYLAAKSFIEDGGMICGCVIEDGVARHRLIDTVEQLEMVKGSKYVQSDISDIYNKIKDQLHNGVKILFFGTPCQVAAMKKVFGSNPMFYSVDIICHGVPPFSYLENHLKHVIKDQDYNNYSFRGEPVDFVLKVYNNENLLYEKYKDQDTYFHAFLRGLSYRENCYNCTYACSDRVGDITIGDFWKIDRSSLLNEYDGNISLVLENNNKGKGIFDRIKSEVKYEERQYQEAIAGNPQLRRPTLRHKQRNLFLSTYIRTQDFDLSVMATTLKNDMKREQMGRTKAGRLFLSLRKAISGK